MAFITSSGFSYLIIYSKYMPLHEPIQFSYFGVSIYTFIIYIHIYIYIYIYIYIFFEAVIGLMCNHFPRLLKTHFLFILQIFRSHCSFFCAIYIYIYIYIYYILYIYIYNNVIKKIFFISYLSLHPCLAIVKCVLNYLN